MEWIDGHVHVGSDRKFLSSSPDEIYRMLDDGIIDRAVIFCMDEVDGIAAGNERISRIASEDDRIAGLFRLDPAIHEPGDLEGAEEFSGFKLHPASQNFGLNEITDHLEAIERTGKPLLSHTGEWGERPHPETLLETALQFPDIDMVFAHGLYGYFFIAEERFVSSMSSADNMYIDLSIHHTAPGLTHMADQVGADRLLFASDYPYGMPQTGRSLVEIAELSDEERRMIAGGNAEKLFF